MTGALTYTHRVVLHFIFISCTIIFYRRDPSSNWSTCSSFFTFRGSLVAEPRTAHSWRRSLDSPDCGRSVNCPMGAVTDCTASLISWLLLVMYCATESCTIVGKFSRYGCEHRTLYPALTTDALRRCPLPRTRSQGAPAGNQIICLGSAGAGVDGRPGTQVA
ncbi:uncharacterized protein LOC126474978 isoform X2 [Schistocerca serialis cubense]|uniref:uncharacterized protein LOC126474978 isoform X2 n=1 Tax=Schistocerca serialis cubense TaxID=2023355 RepID=UPI00214E1279|nr:uncharacterized protein LOC126474978 isoform X2 [Schistocerca serialis cubense]